MLLFGLVPFAQSAKAGFECATLHSDESIRWEKKNDIEDTFECVARSPNNEVLFKIWFDQFPDRAAFKVDRQLDGVVGGVPIVWSVLEDEYILRTTRLLVPGDGEDPPFHLLVGVPRLKCSLLRDVLGQLEVLRIPAQSELP